MRDTESTAMALPAAAEEQLEDLGRRIEALAATTRPGPETARLVIQRRLAGLRERQASARTAVHEAAASIEENMLELETRINIAEQSAAADIAVDAVTFLGAVADELRGWDMYLERLQMKAANTPGGGRERAESAISRLRRRRTALSAEVNVAPLSSAEAWREARERVQAARVELEAGAADVEATLAGARTSDANGLLA